MDVMDVELWKNFPEELMEAVIARLPILTLFRFRSVCKKWKQLSIDFVPQKPPLIFALAHLGDRGSEIGALYDPSTKEWRYSKQAPLPSYCALRSATSAGGLVCYYDFTKGSFWVGNCLTQTWKEFTWGWPDVRGNFTIGMVTLNRGYKIIWADGRRGYWVYDSMKDSTLYGGRIPDNIELFHWVYTSRTVSIGTVVYFLSMQPDGIISYDVVSGKWEQFHIPSPPNSAFSSIAECGGRLLLVALVRDEDSYPSSLACVWELETTMLCWKEVDRMPSSWCSEFINDVTFPVFLDCLGNRRVLVVALVTDRGTWIVTYDVVNREWSKAPRFNIGRCPRWRYSRIENGAAFFPCLSTTP